MHDEAVSLDLLSHKLEGAIGGIMPQLSEDLRVEKRVARLERQGFCLPFPVFRGGVTIHSIETSVLAPCLKVGEVEDHENLPHVDLHVAAHPVFLISRSACSDR